MAEYVIENEKLKLTVSSAGAEKRSLIRKSDGKELLWQADPAFWARTSPVLFPVVGQYRNKISVYAGKEYTMGQHGFARDMEFDLEKQTDSELWFSLKDTDKTHERYPFAFNLKIGYVLENDTVNVVWNVINTDNRIMYFSIVAHPAFNCSLDTYKLQFSKNGSVVKSSLISEIIENDGSGCLSGRQKEITPDPETGLLAMSDKLFSEDALIFENEQADEVTLCDDNDMPVLNLMFDTKLFGIWSPVGKHAPFVCIEPWYGRCDRTDFSGQLEDREYGNSLNPGELFSRSYTIKIF